MTKELRKQSARKRSTGSLPNVAFMSGMSSTKPRQLTALYRPSYGRESTTTLHASGSSVSPTGGVASPPSKLKTSERAALAPGWPRNVGRASRLSYSRAESKSRIRHSGSSAALGGQVINRTKAVKSDDTERLASLAEALSEDLSNAVHRKSSRTARELAAVVSRPSLDSEQPSFTTSFSSATVAQSSVILAWSGEANEEKACTSTMSESSVDAPTTSPLASDYDTDLDIEEEIKPPKKTYDASGRDVYENACKKLGLTPASYMCRRMADTTVAMRHHSLGGEGSRCLAKALVRNAYIEQLDLTDNYLEGEGGVAFGNMLLENSILKELDLSENFLRSRGGTAIAQALKVNESLRTLSLRSNHLMDSDAKSFAEMMKTNETLEKLDLSYNSFGARGGIFLGGGLAVNCALKVLDLTFNCISLRGGVAIATALKTNKTLEVLNLSANGFSLLGCMAFATSLAINKTLLELDLSKNRVYDEGAKYLARGLAKNEGLQVLKIGRNPMGIEGVEELVQSVVSNETLKVLALDELKISAKAVEQITELHKLRGLIVKHGQLSFCEKKVVDPEMGIDLIVKFIKDHKSRLIDLFFQLDKDRSGEVTCTEFKRGLKETGLGMSDEQLTDMIDELDIDGNGRINYSELCSGRQDAVMEKRKRVKSEKKKAVLNRERMRLPTAYFKFDVTGK